MSPLSFHINSGYQYVRKETERHRASRQLAHCLVMVGLGFDGAYNSRMSVLGAAGIAQFVERWLEYVKIRLAPW